MSKPWPINVVALHPLSCGALLWRREGALWVTVVAKATFGIEPESPARLIAPAPLHTEDRHFEKIAGNSLENATDLVPLLPSVGVVLTGHAYAPQGRAVPAVVARLALYRARGNAQPAPILDKRIHVFGDRHAAAPGAPRPFQRMPLRYERAYGGPLVAQNPIGTGAQPGSALPNLVDPTDPARPAGFGPIDAAFPVRRGLLGADDRSALAAAIPALSEAFPFGFFQAAPVDQRVDAIEGHEWIVLDGLHPALPRVRTEIPHVRAVARCALGAGALQPVELYADTLAIDTDQQVFSIVWRGHIGLDDEARLAELRVFTGVEMPGIEPKWPEIQASERRSRPMPPPAAARPDPPSGDAPSTASRDGAEDDADLDDADDGFGDTGGTRLLSRDALLARMSDHAPFEIRGPETAAAAARPDLAATPWDPRGAPEIIDQEDPNAMTRPIRRAALPDVAARSGSVSASRPTLPSLDDEDGEEERTGTLVLRSPFAKPQTPSDAWGSGSPERRPAPQTPSDAWGSGSPERRPAPQTPSDAWGSGSPERRPPPQTPSDARGSGSPERRPPPQTPPRRGPFDIDEETTVAKPAPQDRTPPPSGPLPGVPALASPALPSEPILAPPSMPVSAPPTLASPGGPPSRPSLPFVRDDDEHTMTGVVDVAAFGQTLPWQRANAIPEEETANRIAREAPIPGAPWATGAGASDPDANALPPIADDLTATTLDPPRIAAANDGPPPRTSELVPFVLGAPLSAATLPWQVRPSSDSLTIIAKATFDLVHDGPCALREEADFVVGDLHHDDNPEAALHHASDFAVLKPKTDVTLVGHAHAPSGASPAAQVRFRFGDPDGGGFDRKVAVFGDRTWQRTLVALGSSDPAVFSKMPLRWERAFGGPRYESNPIGVGHKAAAGADGLARLPNLEDPAHLIKGPNDAPAPAGFGPIPPLWKERWSKLGTYDKKWFRSRWPYFPDDFDWTHFQHAPKSQQVGKLRGDESFDIAGAFPDRPILSGRLPGLAVRCFVRKLDNDTKAADSAGGRGARPAPNPRNQGRFEEITLRLDTVAFDADAMKVNLVWRGLVEVSDDDAPEIAQIFLVLDRIDAPPLAAEEIAKRFAQALAPKSDEPETPKAAPPTAPPPDEADEDRSADVEREAAAHEARVLQALRDAGVPEDELTGKPPDPPAPDPKAIADSLRASGASEEEIAGVLEALGPHDDVDAPTIAPPKMSRADVEARVAAGEPLDGLDLSGIDLSGVNLSGQSLQKTLLRKTILRGADLTRANLTGAIASGADLSAAILVGADLTGADLVDAALEAAELRAANVTGADLSGANGKGASFEGALGENAKLVGGTWDDARFDKAQIDRVDLTGASAERARFDGASMNHARLYDLRAPRASFDHAKLANARAEGAQIPSASLKHVAAPASVWERALADGADFTAAVLDGASFLRASCLRARFPGASLVEARLRRTKLGGADLTRANLMQATLERADLTVADLTGANLHGAGLWRANLESTKLGRAILTQSTLAAKGRST